MNWGTPPWTIGFAPEPLPLPAQAGFAVIGGGFAGLAAAAWLRRIAPDESVVLMEASALGSGASGRTGGIALAETGSGDLPGLGDVLAGYREILAQVGVDGGLALPGVFEIGRSGGSANSPIAWQDSGTLRVVAQVPGGAIDPGKVVAGLGRAACARGAVVLENTPVEALEFAVPILVRTAAGTLRARRAIIATNAQSAELSGLAGHSWASFTLAVLTQPLAAADRAALGLGSGKAFYTVDLPYLWGRAMPDGALMFGSGLVDIDGDRDLAALDISSGDAARQFASLERRVRGLHPALSNADFTHRWGGPIRFGNSWELLFDWHPRSRDVLVLNGLGGHGVAQAVYLGCWAAEVLAGRRSLPDWGKIPASP